MRYLILLLFCHFGVVKIYSQNIAENQLYNINKQMKNSLSFEKNKLKYIFDETQALNKIVFTKLDNELSYPINIVYYILYYETNSYAGVFPKFLLFVKEESTDKIWYFSYEKNEETYNLTKLTEKDFNRSEMDYFKFLVDHIDISTKKICLKSKEFNKKKKRSDTLEFIYKLDDKNGSSYGINFLLYDYLVNTVEYY